MKWKKLICKVFGHRYQYNFGWAPNRCKCKRCGMSWKTINNPNYVPGESSPFSEDIMIWVEDTIKEKGEKNKSLND